MNLQWHYAANRSFHLKRYSDDPAVTKAGNADFDSHRGAPSLRSVAAWVTLAIVFAAYVAFFKSSNIFQTTEFKSTPWNPEAGIAVVAGALCGPAAIPVIFAANLISTLLWGPAFSTAWLVTSSALQAAVLSGSGWLFGGIIRGLGFPSTKAALYFLALALAVTLAAATMRIVGFTLTFNFWAPYVATSTLTSSVGNLVGIMTLAPLVVAFPSIASAIAFFRVFGWPQWLIVAGLVMTSYLVFGLKSTDEFKFFYLTFLPVIALAIKEGFRGSIVAVFVSDIAMLAFMLLRDFEPSTATELQVLMIFLSATGLILGSAVSERERFSRQLAESHMRLQESQDALLHASRVSLASEMATALAHELSQPLSAIRNYVRSVRRKLNDRRLNRKSIAEDIDGAVLQVDEAARLIKAAREFIQRREADREIVDLRGLVDNSLELIRNELRRTRISIDNNISADLPRVNGSRIQLQQVILNLVRNSKDALTDAKAAKRQISIDASASTRPGFIEVSVADTGPGVPDGTRRSLFTPLISTKADGLGLGLSLCRTIITAHGGELWYDENYRDGARFSFILPAVTFDGSRR